MLNKTQIAFLLRYSDADSFACSLEDVIDPLLRQKLIEICASKQEGEYYKVSNFGKWLVDKVVNLANAYEVQNFKLMEDGSIVSEDTIAIGNLHPESQECYDYAAENPISIGLNAGKAVESDDSHYAEEIDEEIWDEIQEVTGVTGQLGMLYSNDGENTILDIVEDE